MFHPSTMNRAQTLITRIEYLRMATPIFILGIKDSLERYYVMDLGVIHGYGCLKLLTPMVNKRGDEGGRRDWVESKREG